MYAKTTYSQTDGGAKRIRYRRGAAAAPAAMETPAEPAVQAQPAQ